MHVGDCCDTAIGGGAAVVDGGDYDLAKMMKIDRYDHGGARFEGGDG